jgi:hypothetical protein
VVLIVGLLITNVFSLINEKFHDGLFGALSELVPTSWVKESKYSRHSELSKKHTNLSTKHQALTTKHTNLSTKFDTHKANSKKIAKRIATRTIRNTTVNLAAIPVESVPWLGAGMVLAVTTMDVKDACDNMTDMDSMLKELDLDSSSETGKICGLSTDVAKRKYDDFNYAVGDILHHTEKTYSKKIDDFKEATGDILHHTEKTYRNKIKNFKEATGDILWHMFNGN